MLIFLQYADTLAAGHLYGYRSKRAAIAAYARTARELARYGQECTATLHYAPTKAEVAEYPDFALSLGPRGGVVCEPC